jgi:sulfoxide reductase heme-binding subunit YedZ
MERVNRLVRHVPVGAVWLGCLVPLALLVAGAVADDLGPDPVETIEHRLGEMALYTLLAALAIGPLRRAGLNLIRFRRALGLLSFTYAVLHLACWVILDMGLRWGQMAEDLVRRPYILAGMLALLVMVPLAVTSTDRAIRRMGARAWSRLHAAAHLAALAGVIHLALIAKVWTTGVVLPLVMAIALAGNRLWRESRSWRAAHAAPR